MSKENDNLNHEAGGGYLRTGSASKQAVLEAKRQVVSRKEAVRQASKQAVLEAKRQSAIRKEEAKRRIAAKAAKEQADRLNIEKVKERKALVSEARFREKIRNPRKSKSRKRKRATAGKYIVYGKADRLTRTSKALDRTKVRVPYPGRNKEHI